MSESIEQYRKMLKNIRYLIEKHTDYLKTYQMNTNDNINNKRFFTRPSYDSNSMKRVGVLSTCFALNSLLNSRIDLVEIEHRLLANYNVFRNFAKYLLENEHAWEKYENNHPYYIFATSYRLIYLKKFLHNTNTSIDTLAASSLLKEKGLKFIHTALSNLLVELQKDSRGGAYRPDHAFSAFLTYWALGALWEWREELEDNNNDSEDLSNCSDGVGVGNGTHHLGMVDPLKHFQPSLDIVQEAVDWIYKNERVAYPYRINYHPSINHEIETYSGWRSPILFNPNSHPECWSTSLVFDFLISLDSILEKNLRKELINKFDTKEFNERTNRNKFYERLDSTFCFKGKEKSLKKTIFELILKPRRDRERRFIDLPNAFFLYGPPGTGKTKLTKDVASFLSWSFVLVDTATLLRLGVDNFAESISSVFSYLNDLDKTVVLFDEIDEFIKERKEYKGSTENRMLTNTFLTKLNGLKENRNIIYFISTNHMDEVGWIMQ